MARNTARDWQVIAETIPYYGVFTQDRYQNPTQDDLKEFFATGEADIAYYLSAIRRAFGLFEPKSALDFGCGVGRVLIPLARLTGSATGVDVAEGMLTLAKKHAQESGVNVVLMNTIPVGQTFDWVNSQIVLQHIPPTRGYEIITNLWRAVEKGGVLVLQITTFRETKHIATEALRDFSMVNYDGDRILGYAEQDDQQEPIIAMYDYDLSRVFACMPMADGSPIYMEKTDHGGYHGFRIYVRKH